MSFINQITDSAGRAWISVRSQIEAVKSERRGATAIEYGLIAALIAIALVTVITTLGTSLSGVFQSVSTTLNSATGG